MHAASPSISLTPSPLWPLRSLTRTANPGGAGGGRKTFASHHWRGGRGIIMYVTKNHASQKLTPLLRGLLGHRARARAARARAARPLQGKTLTQQAYNCPKGLGKQNWFCSRRHTPGQQLRQGRRDVHLVHRQEEISFTHSTNFRQRAGIAADRNP